ncbi:MarR family winged helix-turn-helix transcriptional regulator [Streptomyces rubellomurinus]|uniref:MarR family transcriptional regulator n=2 Tax=Streptomyces TaxID=1883 RepID=A0A0F2T9L9_STRR3|nr:MarR family transcriptional regulator [Streptomyces rubellomurinus]KJS54074.1 MarR family transcriptional regulator [Streptomyces rubellomurinus subsp. indigoferus]KJS59929.1 MarR family transcriptional regulator [Streptomyces rubellomurinus]
MDHVDVMLDQWRRERPDLDLAAVGTIGRLGRFALLAGRVIEEVFKQHGLQRGEFDVLATLRRSGAPYELMPSELAALLLMSRAGMTSRIDRLESAGLVERSTDPADRRSVRIALTAAGRALVDAAFTDHAANETALLSGLSGEERATLDGLLRKLLADVEGAENPAP